MYGGRHTGKRLNITCPLCFVCACFFVVLVNSFPIALRLCFACLGGRRKGAHHGGKEKPLRAHSAVAAPAAACGAGAAIAFQVPEELFDRLKDYLAKHGLKQKDFILGLIERELNDAVDAE